MNSPFPWPGGKRLLKKTLLSLLPEHVVYAEPFAGSAKLLFAKTPARFEILNDLNGEVTNFFRVAKHRAAELAERFETDCVHAARFRQLRLAPAPECELDRALRFAYLAWYSFGGKGEHFASARASHARPRRPLTRVRELLRATAARLAAVQVEQRDFADILLRYDSPETLFYLDPPYVHFQSNGRYTALSHDQRDALFATLSEIKGRFLMSFDDCPEVRDLAARHSFHLLPIEVAYTISGGGHTTRPQSPRTSPGQLPAGYQGNSDGGILMSALGFPRISAVSPSVHLDCCLLKPASLLKLRSFLIDLRLVR